MLFTSQSFIDYVADRAKSIRTDAKVNQEATDKMIKALIEEKERLLKELENAKAGGKEGVNQEGEYRYLFRQ